MYRNILTFLKIKSVLYSAETCLCNNSLAFDITMVIYTIGWTFIVETSGRIKQCHSIFYLKNIEKKFSYCPQYFSKEILVYFKKKIGNKAPANKWSRQTFYIKWKIGSINISWLSWIELSSQLIALKIVPKTSKLTLLFFIAQSCLNDTRDVTQFYIIFLDILFIIY